LYSILHQNAPDIQCDMDLGEAVGAGAEEFEEAEVAEDLELLTDFVADVYTSAGVNSVLPKDCTA
jgi:hypothetical protein